MKKPIPFGKYYLLDRISVGGMAEVFKAKAFGVEGFERLIAVKRILPSIAEDEEFITMFIDEAKIAVQLTHANIAQIFDLGKVGDSYFIALEYVAGRDSRTIFDRLRKNGQTVPIPMAAYITMKVCEGLDYAHNKKDAAGRDLNLVHRDVSPQNVLISYDGEVKLIDFGIAKAAGKAGKTQAGILKGKFGYMSPEQVRGLPLDRRSDIFAVGIVLWELVTGERLFVGESDFSTLEKVRNVEIAPPSTYNKRIPEELEKIILKALSREVEDRYQSAMDLHDDLQSWMYTSGNFFARKDLARFMNEVFREEIEQEVASMEAGGGDLARSTVPPPPRAARPGSGGQARPGAPPPPPRASVPPPPPRPTGSGPSPPAPPPRPTGSGQGPPGPPRATSPGRGGGAPPPLPGGSRPGAPPPRPGAKRTMLGMPAAQVPAPGGSGAGAPPPPKPPAQQAVPPDLAGGRVATPSAQGADAGVGLDDWDEDEPPTNIYDKKTAAEMAQAQLSAGGGRSASAPSIDAPEIPDLEEIDEEEPEAPAPREKKSKLPLIIGIGGGVAAAGIIAVLFLVFMGSGSSKGTLQLQVQPSDVEGMEIMLDGNRPVRPGKIPDLSDGQHSLACEAPGYRKEEITFDVQAGETVARSIEMQKEKVESGFYLDTIPAGAMVFVDDRPLDEKTPVTVSDLDPGKHMVRVAKGDAYRQLNLEVDVEEGKIAELPTKKLELMEVEVSFEGPKGVEVALIDGKHKQKLGTIPVKTEIDTSKEYKVHYSHKDYEDTTVPLEYEPGQAEVTIEPELEEKEKSRSASGGSRSGSRSGGGGSAGGGGGASKAPGKLSVQTRPWSTVYINGRKIKNTPIVNHSLKPGTYTVKLENPKYNIERTFRVKIRPGATTTLVKTLI